MTTMTPVPPRLMNTMAPDPEHHDDLQRLLNQLVQDTGTSYGMVFGTHGLHLFRAGDLDQVGAESVTATLTNVLLLRIAVTLSAPTWSDRKSTRLNCSHV